MIVVSDTSAVTNLIQINKLELLKLMYQYVIIPVEVYKELSVIRDQKNIIDNTSWITVEPINNASLYLQLTKSLDKGEAEAIVLAIEKKQIF